MPLASRYVLKLVYFFSGAWLVKRPFFRCCPDCHHLLSRHDRRADGSFRD